METSVSLLERLGRGADDADWQRLDALYRPFVRRRLLHLDPTLADEVDDLVQDVMLILVRELPTFRRERTGSFRAWLREVTLHRVQHAWRQRRHRPDAAGGGALDVPLAHLQDPHSALSRQWDVEHDRYLLRRLLELIENDARFEATTLLAFRRVVFDERKPSEVAEELGISVNAVLLAKSRVLKWLRQETEGLFD